MTPDELKTALANLATLPPCDRYPILSAIPDDDPELNRLRQEAIAPWLPDPSTLTANKLAVIQARLNQETP